MLANNYLNPSRQAIPLTIKLIGFDLDNTLWPVKPAIIGAEQRLSDFLHSLHQDVRYPHPDFMNHRKTLIEADPSLSFRLTAFRRALLINVLSDVPELQTRVETLADQAMDVFLDARSQVQPYPSADLVLAKLGARFSLCALTNGNADLSKIALGRHFAFTRSAEEVGAPKPEPALFLEALKTAKCQPSEMVYVGDDPALDVEAARSLGIFTVWVQSPDAKKPEVEPNYHATIHDLDDLPVAIEQIEQY